MNETTDLDKLTRDAMIDNVVDSLKSIYMINDAIYRNPWMDETDSTKMRQFRYMNDILKKNYTDYSDKDHRIKNVQLSGVFWYIVQYIAQQAVIDGWKFRYGEEREYTESMKSKIHERATYIKKVLNNLQYDGLQEILTKIDEIKRRDHFGLLLMFKTSEPTFDVTDIDESADIVEKVVAVKKSKKRKPRATKTADVLDQGDPRGELKRLQVFAEHQITIQDSDLDELGYPKRLTVEITMANGNVQSKVVRLENNPLAVLFHGTHVDGESSWVGTSVLERNWAYGIMLEWCAFSGADFANNRGSFLWVQSLLENTPDDKLKELHETIMYVLTRNALVSKKNIDVKQIGPGGTAFPIDVIMDKICELMSMGTGIPANKLKGAAEGALSSAKENRLGIYPVLRTEQMFLKPILRKIISAIDPSFFAEFDMDVEFLLKIHMSDDEMEEFRRKQLDNIRQQVDILTELHYNIGEITNAVENPELLPPLPDGDPRNEIIPIEFTQEMEQEPEPPEEEQPEEEIPFELLKAARERSPDSFSTAELIRALLNKPKSSIDEFCGGANITPKKLSQIINYVAKKEERP